MESEMCSACRERREGTLLMVKREYDDLIIAS